MILYTLYRRSKMKEVKKFIIASLVIMLLKIIGGLLCSSYTLIESAIYELLMIVLIILTSKNKENNKKKAILSSLIGLLFIILGAGGTLLSFTYPVKKVSFGIILFVILSILIRYAVGCFTTNTSYNRRKGLLTISYLNSNMDFLLCGVSLTTLLSKINVFILKDADKIGCIFILGLIIWKALKIILNSFKVMEDEHKELSEEYTNEITNRTEVKKIDKLVLNNFGGIKAIKLDVELKENISIIDLNTFIVTLQDYLLKEADVAYLIMSNNIVKKKVNVRSLKQDARNSGSRNSKTNVKKTNSRKKNQKR